MAVITHDHTFQYRLLLYKSRYQVIPGIQLQRKQAKESASKTSMHPGNKAGKTRFVASNILTDMFVNFFGNLVFWKGSKHLVYNLAVFEHKKRRNASDTIL